MNEPATPAPAVDSRAGFAAAVRWGFETAFTRGARRIVTVDRDFAQWPLDDPALLESLTRWLKRPQRQWVLLAATYDEMARRHPRFVRWRADWAHAISPYAPPPEDRVELPSLLVDDGPVVVQLFDAVHWRGRALLDAREARSWRENLDALLQRSGPEFPVSRLGL